jgi:hypothetical protein
MLINFPAFDTAVISLADLLDMDSALSTAQNPLKEKSVETLVKSLVKTKRLIRPIEVALLRNHRYLVSGRNRTEALKRATLKLYEAQYLNYPDAITEIKLLQSTLIPVILHTVNSTEEVIRLITASNQSRAMSATEKGLLNVSATTAFYDITDPNQRQAAIDAVYEADGSEGLLAALAVNAAKELSRHMYIRGDVPVVLTADALGTCIKKTIAAFKRDTKPKKGAVEGRTYMNLRLSVIGKQGTIDLMALIQAVTHEVITEKMTYRGMLGEKFIDMPSNFAREGIGVTYPEVVSRVTFLYQSSMSNQRKNLLRKLNAQTAPTPKSTPMRALPPVTVSPTPKPMLALPASKATVTV